MDSCSFLSHPRYNDDCLVYAPREDLESNDKRRSLLRYSRYLSGHGDIQCDLRLCNFNTSYGTTLALANASKKETQSRSTLCNWYMVSGYTRPGNLRSIPRDGIAHEKLLILLCSVCMTSIMRSYYTTKLLKGSDTTYFLGHMGLWTWAEISSGIIVGCLPVMPKFLQTLGSSLQRSLCWSSKPSLRSLQLTRPTQMMRRLYDRISLKNPLAKRTDNSTESTPHADSYSFEMPRIRCAPLDNMTACVLKNTSKSEPGWQDLEDQPTKRQDLEFAL